MVIMLRLVCCYKDEAMKKILKRLATGFLAFRRIMEQKVQLPQRRIPVITFTGSVSWKPISFFKYRFRFLSSCDSIMAQTLGEIKFVLSIAQTYRFRQKMHCQINNRPRLS